MKVICIISGGWLSSIDYTEYIGPKKDEICIVIGEDVYGYLLKDYPISEGYNKSLFREIDESWAESILEEISKELIEEELILTN